MFSSLSRSEVRKVSDWLRQKCLCYQNKKLRSSWPVTHLAMINYVSKFHCNFFFNPKKPGFQHIDGSRTSFISEAAAFREFVGPIGSSSLSDTLELWWPTGSLVTTNPGYFFRDPATQHNPGIAKNLSMNTYAMKFPYFLWFSFQLQAHSIESPCCMHKMQLYQSWTSDHPQVGMSQEM